MYRTYDEKVAEIDSRKIARDLIYAEECSPIVNEIICFSDNEANLIKEKEATLVRIAASYDTKLGRMRQRKASRVVALAKLKQEQAEREAIALHQDEEEKAIAYQAQEDLWEKVAGTRPEVLPVKPNTPVPAHLLRKTTGMCINAEAVSPTMSALERMEAESLASIKAFEEAHRPKPPKGRLL